MPCGIIVTYPSVLMCVCVLLLQGSLVGNGEASAIMRSKRRMQTGSVDQQLEQCLHDFVRIPSVSSNKCLKDQCLRAAKFVSKLLESLGAEVKLVRYSMSQYF